MGTRARHHKTQVRFIWLIFCYNSIPCPFFYPAMPFPDYSCLMSTGRLISLLGHLLSSMQPAHERLESKEGGEAAAAESNGEGRGGEVFMLGMVPKC